MEHFSTIAQYVEKFNHPLIEHPLFHIQTNCESDGLVHNEEISYSTDFYFISLRKVKKGKYSYGRTKYDFSNGTLFFTKPRQFVTVDNELIDDFGYTIIIHEDFLIHSDLNKRIKKYACFDYSVNEALHLSPKEEKQVLTIFEIIESEYHNNQDKFSKGLVIKLIDVLLEYSDRFYQRQFSNRKPLNTRIFVKFNEALATYFEQNLFEENGTPSLDYIANMLGVTQRYLSDAIKVETGEPAIDQINLYLIEKAKNLLLAPNTSVAEVAYKLGYEYPQYFSRMFKKKVGMSPTEYIETASMK